MPKKLSSLIIAVILSGACLAQGPFYYPISGKVDPAPDGTSPAGRTIRFYLTDPSQAITTTVEKDGTFTLNVFDLWPDVEVAVGVDYKIDSPLLTGYSVPTKEVRLTGIGYEDLPSGLLALLPAVVTKEVVPVYAGISGTVKDTAGNPLGGALVTADTRATATATTGAYSFINLDPGTYVVTVTKTDYIPSSQEVTVSAGDSKTADFALASIPVAETRIRAKVVDSATGAVMAGANVKILGGEEKTTDASGKVSFSVAPGKYQLEASMKYYISKIETLTLAKGETKELEIALKLSVPPKVENIYFGNRAYQKALVEQGEKFYIPKTPKITSRLIAGDEESGVKIQSISVSVDPDRPWKTKTYATDRMTLTTVKSVKVAEVERVQSLSLSHQIPEADELDIGEHVITFSAENDYGLVGSFAATVEVIGGPLRIVDVPITFPSPFSPTKNREVFIQYTLSDNAPIDIYIYSIAGELIKKFSCGAGEEGGTGQLNKVKWNGILDVGGVVGNGIYVGTIVSRNDNKVLGKFKLNVFD